MTRQEIARRLQTAGAWVQQGKLREAGEICRDVVREHPSNPDALHLLGLIEGRAGSARNAVELLTRAIRISPRVAHFHNTLGTVLGGMNRPELAVLAFSRAVELQPDLAEARANLQLALAHQKESSGAETSLRRAIALAPGDGEAHCNLGSLLRKQGKLTEALAEYEQAIRLDRTYPRGYSGRAAVYREFGDRDAAVDSYRSCLSLVPADAMNHSNLLYAMHYQPEVSSEELFAEHLAWARHHAEPLYRQIKPFANVRDPDRRLHIGYISPDFREHPRARFIEPLLARHDRSRFEVFCYSDTARPDELTARFRKMADVWRETAGAPDDVVGDLIRRDGIDLLIDSTGHSARNRMLLLARKPAPIQVLYPGYPNTSGLKTIDYWITDAYQDPPRLTEQFRTEQMVRIEPFKWCYTPSDNSPPVGPLPATRNGFITFAAFNNPVKNNAKVLELWSRLMSAMPTARMMVLVGLGAENAVANTFARYGIPASRLDIVARLRRDRYLSLYQKVDIMLDPFPYNGYTTTLDSLWMGVPVVTLAGDTNVSRAGVSILSNIELRQWIVSDTDEYLGRAIHFASDIPALSELRSTVRQRMQASPLMDLAGFVPKVEAAYRSMWKRWCERTRHSQTEVSSSGH